MSTALDEDLLVVEDLDFEIACEALSGCDKTATWQLLRKCCDGRDLLCDEHHVQQDAWMNSVMAAGFSVMCDFCKTRQLDNTDVWWERL